jgi:hypothetical protein
MSRASWLRFLRSAGIAWFVFLPMMAYRAARMMSPFGVFAT